MKLPKLFLRSTSHDNVQATEKSHQTTWLLVNSFFSMLIRELVWRKKESKRRTRRFFFVSLTHSIHILKIFN